MHHEFWRTFWLSFKLLATDWKSHLRNKRIVQVAMLILKDKSICNQNQIIYNSNFRHPFNNFIAALVSWASKTIFIWKIDHFIAWLKWWVFKGLHNVSFDQQLKCVCCSSQKIALRLLLYSHQKMGRHFSTQTYL